MPNLSTEELQQDARIVVDYATRVGLLPDDALPKALNAVQKAEAKGLHPDTTSLLVALNDAVNAISPVSLADLRAGRSPFQPRGQRINKRLQITVCSLTIILTSLIAYFTEQLHREEAAVHAIQQIQDLHPLDLLNQLRKMAQYEGVFEKRDSQYDEYNRTIRELRQIEEKVSASSQLLNAVANGSTLPFGDKLRTFFKNFLPESKSSSGDLEVGWSSGTPTPGLPPVIRTSLNSSKDPCDPISVAKAVDIPNLPLNWLQMAIKDSEDEFCFSTKLKFGTNAFNVIPTSDALYKIQERIALKSGWVLPFLYGLLGASVYLMRSLLSTRVYILDSSSFLLRVSLGGIAGIIIGWFWTPGSSSGSELMAVSSVPFGLAFLAGFSIDILFSLLDRMNRALSEQPTEQNTEEPEAKITAT